MTGKEAIKKLEEGFILRRKAWEPDIKCKAYFSNEEVPEHSGDSEYISYFDCLDDGDFFEDDWEIVDEIL